MSQIVQIDIEGGQEDEEEQKRKDAGDHSNPWFDYNLLYIIYCFLSHLSLVASSLWDRLASSTTIAPRKRRMSATGTALRRA